MNNIVKNHLRHPGEPPGGRGNGPRGPRPPPDSELSKISKISRNLSFRLIRHAKMSIYKEERPSSDGHKITFPDSNDFIIQGMAPGNAIFDETGEIRVLRWPNEAVQKKRTVPYCIFLDLPILYTSSLRRSISECCQSRTRSHSTVL